MNLVAQKNPHFKANNSPILRVHKFDLFFLLWRDYYTHYEYLLFYIRARWLNTQQSVQQVMKSIQRVFVPPGTNASILQHICLFSYLSFKTLTFWDWQLNNSLEECIYIYSTSLKNWTVIQEDYCCSDGINTRIIQL